MLGEHTLPGRQCILITSTVPATQFPGCAAEWHLRCAVCLLWGADLWLQPSWWMSTVQDPRKTWLATWGLLRVWWRMPSLVPKLPLSLWPRLSLAFLSASGGGWASPQQASSPLVFPQSFVL